MMPATSAQGAETPIRQLVERVVVPIEGGSEELLVQQWAVGMADALGADLRAIHISTDGLDPPADVFSYISRRAAERGIRFDTAIVNATNVVDELAAELSPTDLVVIGTRLLGTAMDDQSVTEELIRVAPCPVQVIRID